MGIYSERMQQVNADTNDVIKSSDEYAKVLTAEKDNAENSEKAEKKRIKTLAEYKKLLTQAVESAKSGSGSIKKIAEEYGISLEELGKARVIYDTIDALGSLNEKYGEIKESAQKSVEGQYKIWSDAAVVIPKDIESINNALETQLAYWKDYNIDLADLSSRAGDIEGLSEVIASFADGSAESVNAIKGMSDASDDELRKMVDF